MATETRCKSTILTAGYPRLPNRFFSDLLLKNVEAEGPHLPTEEEMQTIKKIKPDADFSLAGIVNHPMPAPVLASSDVDTVSWLTPLAEVYYACYPPCMGHSRELALLADTTYALRGMVKAARILAKTATDLFADPSRLAPIRSEFEERTQDFVFDPIVSPKQVPSGLFFASAKRADTPARPKDS